MLVAVCVGVSTLLELISNFLVTTMTVFEITKSENQTPRSRTYPMTMSSTTSPVSSMHRTGCFV